MDGRFNVLGNQMSVIKANGINLFYELNGDATVSVAVFINGLFQDTTSWALAVRDFSLHFRTLVYDCRGQGQSDKPHEGPYTSELHARDLAALLDALKIERAHFVGLSNGGLVLMHFSKLFPQRLDRIVFVDTFSHMNAVQQAMLKSWRAALETGGSALRFLVSLPWTWSADFLERNYQAIMDSQAKAAQLPTHSSIHLVNGAMTHDARPWLGEIKAPTLIVHGDQDRMAPLYYLQTLHQSIPHARLYIIKDGGHAAWLEKADEFNRVALEFLQSGR